jgi:hypothetical protein
VTEVLQAATRWLVWHVPLCMEFAIMLQFFFRFIDLKQGVV